MPWLVIEPIPLDRLLMVAVVFTVPLGLLGLAALLGYAWECIRVIRIRGVKTVRTQLDFDSSELLKNSSN